MACCQRCAHDEMMSAVTVPRSSAPLFIGGSFAVVSAPPVHVAPPFVQTFRALGLHESAIVDYTTPRTLAFRGGQWTGGQRRHIVSGNGETEPLVWTPSTTRDRVEYVNRQWTSLEADVVRAGDALPLAWRQAFLADMAQFRGWYLEHRTVWTEPAMFGLLGYREVANAANNWLRRLIRWREQFVAHGQTPTGPPPEEQEGPDFGLERATEGATSLLTGIGIIGALLLMFLVLRR